MEGETILRKNKFVKDYKNNDDVNELFVLALKSPVKPYAKGYRFELKLQDTSGEIVGKFWGGTDQGKVKTLWDSLRTNSVVNVVGKFEESDEWGDSINMRNETDIIMVAIGSYALEDFIRKSNKDCNELLKELKKIKEMIEDEEIKKVVNSFFDDEEFMKKFSNCPAAMTKHHGWIGGLLEHSVSVAKFCLTAADFHKELKRDLLISGALLHDIGKTRELETTTRIYYTDEGNLIGHIVLGIQMLTEKMDELSISESTKQKLIHLIISHHGSGEFGSPISPCFPEAMVVHKADDLDAKTVQMIDEIRNAQTDEKFAWSKDFNRIMVRD